MSDLLTSAEVAELLGVKRNSITRAVCRGTLTPVSRGCGSGDLSLFTREEVMRYEQLHKRGNRRGTTPPNPTPWKAFVMAPKAAPKFDDRDSLANTKVTSVQPVMRDFEREMRRMMRGMK